MNKIDAQSSTISLSSELMSLNPSAIVTFFEIDVTDIAWDIGLTNLDTTVFRYHNTVSLFNTNIFWQGNLYRPAPIKAEGFDLNTKGTMATPTLSLAVDDYGVAALSQLKETLRQMGDLVGAKVTRKRTLVKYLDEVNFAPAPIGIADTDRFPDGYSQNWNLSFPDDVYFIARKSNENKYVLEYELNSILELEGVQLPNRIVSCQKCMFKYRGAGCYYEFRSRYNPTIHENCGESLLPVSAPPVASTLDLEVLETLNLEASQLIDRGEFSILETYNKGDFTFLKKNNLNYYYVCKQTCQGVIPPNTTYWIEDQCSKTIYGCRLRFLKNGNVFLPFGGFPTVGKFSG